MRQSRRSSEIVNVKGVGPQLVPDAQLVNFGDGFVGSPHVNRLPRLKAKRSAQSLDRPKKRNSFVLQHSRMVNALTTNVNTFTTKVSKLPYMTQGQRIKQMRIEKYRTQQALADVLKCSRPLIAMWERDEVQELSGKYLTRLARAFGKSAEWIQTGAADPAQKLITDRLTEEDSDEPATQELINIRNKNNFHALRIFIGTMAAVTYSMRPAEGAAVLAAIRAQKGIDEFVSRGLGRSLVKAIERAVKGAEAQPSLPRPVKR